MEKEMQEITSEILFRGERDMSLICQQKGQMLGRGAKGKQPDRDTEMDLHLCTVRKGKRWVRAALRQDTCFPWFPIFLFSLYFK